jgi:hypothetical protein
VNISCGSGTKAAIVKCTLGSNWDFEGDSISSIYDTMGELIVQDAFASINFSIPIKLAAGADVTGSCISDNTGSSLFAIARGWLESA